jgi:hypothetical protein
MQLMYPYAAIVDVVKVAYASRYILVVVVTFSIITPTGSASEFPPAVFGRFPSATYEPPFGVVGIVADVFVIKPTSAEVTVVAPGLKKTFP